MLFDYGTLRLIWWALLGVLLIGFAIMDGFDLGVAMLHPFVPRTETQRRVLLNAIGPVWEGNQVWFILGGGAIFAAWPLLYAASFSGFYLAMMLVLLGLILRPVALTFRGKIELFRLAERLGHGCFSSPVSFRRWCSASPSAICCWEPRSISTSRLQLEYEGDLLGLLNPFALLCGVVSVAMLTMQGASFLASKSEGEVARRAAWFGAGAALMPRRAVVDRRRLGRAAAWMGLSCRATSTRRGRPIRSGKAWSRKPAGGSTTSATRHRALPRRLSPIWALLERPSRSPRARRKLALLSSSVAVAGVIATAGFSLFPFLLPSSSHPDHSLTVWDASSSPTTLSLMLVAALFFLPIVLAYTGWVFHVLRGPVTEAAIERGDDYHY